MYFQSEDMFDGTKFNKGQYQQDFAEKSVNCWGSYEATRQRQC